MVARFMRHMMESPYCMVDRGSCDDKSRKFNDLYDSLCYGHDAELLISGNRVFVEWNGEKIELFQVVGDTCNKLCELSDITKIDTVKMLFDTSIFEKNAQ